MTEQLCAARELQQKRGFYNAHIPPKALRKLHALDEADERTLETAARRLGLSARARVLKVARAGADLDQAEMVSSTHLAEAVQYRSLDRNYLAMTRRTRGVFQYPPQDRPQPGAHQALDHRAAKPDRDNH